MGYFVFFCRDRKIAHKRAYRNLGRGTMATLTGVLLDTDGLAPNPWRRWPRGCPISGPIPVTKPGDICPRFAHSHIYFRALQTPYFDAGSTAVIISGEVRAEIDDHTGAFTVTLNQGNYECWVGSDCFQINIPTDAGNFLLQNVIISDMNFLPPALNTYQGTFPSTAADFVLPANAVSYTGLPVATGWTQVVQGPGKYQIEAAVMILATSRGNGAQDNEIYTFYLWDSTNLVVVGLEVTAANIFTGTQGQMILRGTVNIAGPTTILLEVYGARNPNDVDQTPAPASVGTVVMEQSSISITRLS